ncbi:hypothetical protein Hamer_G019439 [Homarus americanus]|uniref:Uncharacterized protein n=1 Tax=Homarus americanus TaxID=6706 RepID=A0A8J5MVT4_HOMAM|nr:hypothetical protein Hamer_G019439 [Homarus americanus]
MGKRREEEGVWSEGEEEEEEEDGREEEKENKATVILRNECSGLGNVTGSLQNPLERSWQVVDIFAGLTQWTTR